MKKKKFCFEDYFLISRLFPNDNKVEQSEYKKKAEIKKNFHPNRKFFFFMKEFDIIYVLSK